MARWLVWLMEIRVPHFGCADRIQGRHIKVIHLIQLVEKEMGQVINDPGLRGDGVTIPASHPAVTVD